MHSHKGDGLQGNPCRLDRRALGYESSRTVRYAIAELIVATGLMTARKTHLETLTVDLKVRANTLTNLIASSLDNLEATLFAHRFGREVCMRSGTIPIAIDGLWIERCVDALIFTEPVQKPTSDPEMIASCKGSESGPPIWNSHCPGITSAFTPASSNQQTYMHPDSSTISRP